VALEIRGRQLLIAGERRPAEAAGRLYQQIEIEHGPFRRLVELGADVIAEEAKASYEDGILRVEVPLAPREEQQSRRVPIEEAEGGSPGLEGADR
jgi:HSP20 family protein